MHRNNFFLIEIELKSLNGYVISVRYPGQTCDREDAKNSIRQAGIVRRFIRERLGLEVGS